MDKIKRKLATILAADCVNFSKHMETNEEKTLKNLNDCRFVLEPLVELSPNENHPVHKKTFKEILDNIDQ